MPSPRRIAAAVAVAAAFVAPTTALATQTQYCVLPPSNVWVGDRPMATTAVCVPWPG